MQETQRPEADQWVAPIPLRAVPCGARRGSLAVQCWGFDRQGVKELLRVGLMHER